MSGLFDLKSVRASRPRSLIRFSDEIEQAMSPQRHIELLRAPVVITYGTNDAPEFRRQSCDFFAALAAAGKPARLIEAAHFGHIEMAESLGNPYAPNGRAALELLQLSGGSALHPGTSRQRPKAGDAR
jgi:arylformamidase